MMFTKYRDSYRQVVTVVSLVRKLTIEFYL